MTREPIKDSIIDEQLEALISERASEGIECHVEVADGQRVLVCVLPDL